MRFSNQVSTLRQVIEVAASAHPETPFLIGAETGQVITLGDLENQCKFLSTLLHQRGLRARDKVALLMDNGLVTVQLFLGSIYGGLVVVPLNVRAGVVQISYMLEHCDAKAVFVEEQYRALLEEAMHDVRRPIQVIPACLDGTIGGGTEGNSNASLAVLLDLPAPDDEALLMYSSGSTGKPKAAIHTHRSILAGGRNAIASHELTPADRSLLVLPLYHINAECVTLIPTLMSGGSVVVPHRFSVSHFWDWMEQYRCTWSAVVPTIVSELVNWNDPRADQREATFQRIKFMRSSSAPLSPSLHREFLDKFPVPLLQAMGSTEGGNVFSNPLPPRKNKIGSPGLAWGFETRIVDRDGVEVPAGESGEVLLRGPALMRAYYKDAEGTAAVVDADGWLHTGDLAYRDEDGYFFVVGRSKELVIKGGVNIAPRQIDETLESHPAVLEAAAVGIPDRHLGEDLVAFVVRREGASTDEHELLSFCEKRLGHFKTPTWICFADDLPKGPSGKVQRLKLFDAAVARAAARSSQVEPEPQTQDGHLSSSPASVHGIEELIASTWAEILALPKVDADSNFFALGGHSLLAIQCLSRLRERMPQVLTLSDFFEHGTVAEQAALVRSRLRAADGESHAGLSGNFAEWEQTVLQQFAPPVPAAIPRRDSSVPCPLSPAQQRLWFLEQVNGGVPVYNEAEAVRLRGPLNVAAFERALNGIVSRHETLRSTVRVIEGIPHSVVHQSWPLVLKKIDLSALQSAEREREVSRLLIDDPRVRYRLEEEPGVRATLLRLGAEDHVFILMLHHIIGDWASEGVIWRELSALYRAELTGKPPELPPLPIQDGDYAAWQSDEFKHNDFEPDLAFWEENLRGAPQLLELPSDRQRPAALTYRGKRQRFVLNASLTAKLRDLSAASEVTLFTVCAAALSTLLYRYTGQEDIPLGIPINDRERAEFQQLIGFLLHTQVLRTPLEPGMTFRALMARVQKAAIDMYLHRAAPFDQVVRRLRPERNRSYSPLFQVMLNWRDRDQMLSFIGLDRMTVESLLAESRTSKFDLTLFATDCGEEIWLEAEYSTDLFDDDRIARMLRHFETLLESVASDPGQRLSEYQFLPPEERQLILEQWNQTALAFQQDRRLHELFEEQVRRTPDALAACFGDLQWTYRELDQRANQLAGYLQSVGAGPNVLVAVAMERSLQLLAGILAILKTGGAYLPLDPNYPKARLNLILDDANAAVVLAEEAQRPLLAECKRRVVFLDTDQPAIRSASPLTPARGSADDLAYVIYTSGSTGVPKGVAATHRSTLNRLEWMWARYPFSKDDVCCAKTSINFVDSVSEIFTPLLRGVPLVLISAGNVQDVPALVEILDRRRITRIVLVPALLRELLATLESTGAARKSSLRMVVTSGEALTRDLARAFFDVMPPDTLLLNLYGSSEVAGDVTAFEVNRNCDRERIPIGRPIANTQIYILDRHLNPVPIGVAGELLAGGLNLAREYLNRPELTAERFVANPFGSGRLYRTGDLARYLPDGDIEYLGRADHQVKIRGFRIELGEIEAAVKDHHNVADCAVIVHGDDPLSQSLNAYLVPVDARRPPAISDLRDALREKVPAYMLPASFRILQEFPLLPNGKVDRKALALLRPVADTSYATDPAPFSSPLELQLARVWSELLKAPVAGVQDSFFDLGGHSLLAVRLVNEVNRIFNTGLTIPGFLADPTVAGMAKLLRLKSAAIREPNLIPLRAGRYPGRVFFLGSGVGLCRLGQTLDGPAVFSTVVPFLVSSSGVATLPGHASPPTLQEMASVYATLIESNLDSGPAVLVGHSFTGLLAFETARQLARKGHSIDRIVLIDAWARQSPWLWKVRTLTLARFRSKVRRMLAGFKRISNTAPVQSPVSTPETRYQSLDEMPMETFQRTIQYALKNYQLQPLASRAVLFRARDSHKAHLHAYDPALGWDGLFTRGLDLFEMPGDHSTILLRENLPGISRQLQQQLSSPPEKSSWNVDAVELSAASRY